MRRHRWTIVLAVIIVGLVTWLAWVAVAPDPSEKHPETQVAEPTYCKLMSYSTMEARIDQAVSAPAERAALPLVVPNPDKAPGELRDDLIQMKQAVASDTPEVGRAAARRLDADAATRCR